MFYFDSSIKGYETYRSIIHRNCITGILHTIFMPIACVGFFICLYCLFSWYCIRQYDKYNVSTDAKKLTKCVLYIIQLSMLIGYLQFDPLFGVLSMVFYFLIINSIIDHLADANTTLFNFGLLLLGGSIVVMEFIGHWYLEDHASNLYEFFNSVYFTPLYGIKSLVYYPLYECGG